ncbi:MAG: DNA-formamidopyrimidine glycosylase family protein [Anaerolineae bacterium]|jgi:formamidopyrimidine-DNA glycosylase
MPELPDVEVLRRYLDATSLRQEIETVEVRSCQVLEGISAAELAAGLEARSFESTRRHGKYLLAALDSGRWLMLHFGMTGGLKYFSDMGEDPTYDRLLITFSDGYHLAYEAQRKLGKIRLIEDVKSFIEEKGLGPDALASDFDLAAFRRALAERRGMTKSTLMNQHIVAGIGNIYADEILFQVDIHPRAKINQLDDEVLGELFEAMREVLRTAVDCQADPNRFPDSYIIPHRRNDGECPKCGGDLGRVKVCGRSAYHCPNCQTRRLEE